MKIRNFLAKAHHEFQNLVHLPATITPKQWAQYVHPSRRHILPSDLRPLAQSLRDLRFNLFPPDTGVAL